MFMVPGVVLGVSLSALALAPGSAALASSVKPNLLVANVKFISENPPATSPTAAATFIVNVAPKTSGAAPTGTVSFTWTKTSGGGGTTSGPVGSGTATLSPASSGPGSDATITGYLPAGSTDGSLTMTAVYSGDSTYGSNTGQAPYWVEADCYTSAWPSDTAGLPDVIAGAPTGFYIGQSQGEFILYATSPVNDTHFTGSVVTNGDGVLLNVSPIKTEGNDIVALRGDYKIHFGLHDHGYLEGFSFYAGCGQALTFNLQINGVNAKVHQIHLGTDGTSYATANPESLYRPA